MTTSNGMDLNTVKDLATIAKPLVDPLIAALIAPKLKSLSEFLDKRGIDKKIKSEEVEQKLKNYLISAYEKYCTMNVLVFPNQQILIQNIYQPLSLVNNKTHKVTKFDTIDIRIIEEFERLLIADSAGMGKSTLTKWIGASLIEKKSSIPILIELKRLNDKHKIIDEVCEQLGDIFGEFDKEIIIHFISDGKFCFLLDGFDEIRYEYRESVITDLKDFIRKARHNWFILTSRPDSELSSFGDFQIFNIQPLTTEESFELIRKYDSVNNIIKIGEQLIQDIKNKLGQVSEFLINPFLVSLLYKTYTYNKDIPTKKTTFYNEIYGALYKTHDLSKDGFRRNKLSKLDFEDFRTVVNQLAYNTAKTGEVEYYENELINALNHAQKECVGISFKNSAFAEDLEHSVPLFARDGGILKWAHKSLQDFFAASYIKNSVNKREIVRLFYESKKSNYINIIDFLIEMEYKIVRDVIVYDIADSYVKFCNSSYKEIKNVAQSDIRKRQEVSFDCYESFTYIEQKKGLVNSVRKELRENARFLRNSLYVTFEPANSKSLANMAYIELSFRYEIMKILYKKQYDIFKKYDSDSSYDSGLPASLRLQNILNPKADSLYEINDNVNNPLNEANIFNMVTQIQWEDKQSNDLMSGFVLDYDKCIKLIKGVERGVKKGASSGELSGI